MIKQLNISKPRKPYSKADWPENPDQVKTLFSGRKPLRKMRILIDADLIDPPAKPRKKIDKRTTLEALLQNGLVEVYKYSDNGPPANVKPTVYPIPPSLHPAYEGWAVAHAFESGHWPVTHAYSKEEYAVSGVTSNAPQVARGDDFPAATAAMSPERREADVLALHVASEAVEADLFITERPYLYSGRKLASEPGVTVCGLEDALTIVSLYLRTQEEYVLPTGTPGVKFRFNKGLFYWVGTRELLPEGWRWFSACVQHSTGSGDDKLLALGGSTLSRVTRALQSRDDVHAVLNQPSNNDTSDDALGSLDNVLVLLMGAIDAAARVAHVILGLPAGSEYSAAWQKPGWINQVAGPAPGLASLVGPGTDGANTLTILRLLRNSVHGEALEAMGVQSGDDREMLIGLPARDEADLLLAMDALGGRDSWGLRPLIPGRSHIEPAVLVDRLFEAVVRLLNDLMKETPVETLAHVRASVRTARPPVKRGRGNFNTFSEWNRRAIRWQLGF